MWDRTKRALRGLLMLAGLVLLTQLLLALTGWQKPLHRWLLMPEAALDGAPDIVVVLGGGGIPSESGLMRCYSAAEKYAEAPDALFVVSLPTDGEPEESSVGLMRDELVMRGVPFDQIVMETEALNTFQQSNKVRDLLGDDALQQEVLIVTSWYHMRRAVECFQSAGFVHVGGLPAFEVGAEADPGSWTGLRYEVWANLEAQVVMARELIALFAYRARGWI